MNFFKKLLESFLFIKKNEFIPRKCFIVKLKIFSLKYYKNLELRKIKIIYFIIKIFQS